MIPGRCFCQQLRATSRTTQPRQEIKNIGFDIKEMLVGVTPLSEIVRYTSPLAGPLPESLRGLADQDRLTDGTAAAGCATVEASAAAAAEHDAVASTADAECAAVGESAAAVECAAVGVSAASGPLSR